jgi:flagellar basal body-associated protein FliL
MGRLPSKFLFCIILYGAGFVTAVYFLAPKSASGADQSQTAEMSSWFQPAQAVTENTGVDSKVWVMKVRAGIDTSIHFAEEHALKVANLVRSKMAQGSNPSSQTVVE